jgi:hypothetical protein
MSVKAHWAFSSYFNINPVTSPFKDFFEVIFSENRNLRSLFLIKVPDKRFRLSWLTLAQITKYRYLVKDSCSCFVCTKGCSTVFFYFSAIKMDFLVDLLKFIYSCDILICRQFNLLSTTCRYFWNLSFLRNCHRIFKNQKIFFTWNRSHI